jgi:hypothetical protein
MSYGERAEASILLAEPVGAGGAEPVGECKDGLSKPACDIPPHHSLATEHRRSATFTSPSSPGSGH